MPSTELLSWLSTDISNVSLLRDFASEIGISSESLPVTDDYSLLFKEIHRLYQLKENARFVCAVEGGHRTFAAKYSVLKFNGATLVDSLLSTPCNMIMLAMNLSLPELVKISNSFVSTHESSVQKSSGDQVSALVEALFHRASSGTECLVDTLAVDIESQTPLVIQSLSKTSFTQMRTICVLPNRLFLNLCIKRTSCLDKHKI